MSDLKYIGKNILNHDLILKKGHVSGSAASTGSFGRLEATVIGGNSPLRIESDSFILSNDGTVSGSVVSTGSFGSIRSAGLPLHVDSGNVGIGLTNPEDYYNSPLVTHQASVNYLTIATNTNGISSILMADGTSGDQAYRGQLEYKHDGDEWRFHAANTHIMTLKDGNVGIGETTPDQKLSITGNIKVNGNITGSGIRIGGGSSKFSLTDSTPNGTANAVFGDAQFGSTSTTNTGITLFGTGQVGIAFGDAGLDRSGQFRYQHSTDKFEIITDNAERATIDSSGINVTGNITASGNILANGNIVGDGDTTISGINTITTGGNISGSATSTGSFGRVQTTTAKFGETSILSNSRMGIGIDTPTTEDANTHVLHIHGPTSQLHLTNDTNGSAAADGLLISSWSNNKAYIDHRESGALIFAAGGTNTLFVVDGNVGIGDETPTYKLDVTGTGRFTGDLTLGGNLVGDDATNISGVNNITALGNISGSATSTGSFGRVQADSGSFDSVKTSGNITSVGGVTVTGTSKLQAFRTSGQFIEIYPDGNGSNYLQAQGNIRFAPNLGTKMILHANGRLGINTTTDAGFQMDVNGTSRLTGDVTLGADISGSHDSTGSFGNVRIEGMSVSDVTVFSSSLSTRITNDSASISARITADSSSISARITADSSSISARITADSSSFAARDTLSEATSSKILNGELEFTNITGSGHISMSMFSTASFGRLEATTIGGHSPLSIDSVTTFNETTNFQNYISMSSAGTLDLKGKLLIQTGSILGDLHIRTNEDLMRFGKATTGLVVSGSSIVSRFATAADGSEIDLGFTVTDEDGDEVVSGDGDGIHVDSNNYWYNNTFYRVGDSNVNNLQYDGKGMRYYGELYAQTGSIDGELYIKSPTGSMFIGKYTGGFTVSGSGNMSRFATGSDGSIVDLGFTITDEEGATQVISTGDGLYVDDNSFWYTTGNFRVGDGSKQIDWNKKTLTVSASSVDVTTLKASDVNFSNLPTSDPLVTGSLWVSGSSLSGSYASGFVMISGMHG